MMYGVDVDALQEADPLYTIAEEVFTAMVDGESGYLVARDGPLPAWGEAVYAWVDVHGPVKGRVVLSTDEPTAQRITKALLGVGPDEVIDDADLVDALGEMANIVGGNLRALSRHGRHPESTALPEVGHEAPADEYTTLVHQLAVSWRDHPFVISVWAAPQ
jgi:chemotaxis protein CheX